MVCGYDMSFPECQATYEKQTLGSDDEFDREYAIANTQCETTARIERNYVKLAEGDGGYHPLPSILWLSVVIGTLGALMML